VNIVLLTGGQGGLKLFEGLRELIDPETITVVVNTADNIWLLDLYIAPDVDSATYLACGLLDTGRYWGIINDTFNTYSMIRRFNVLDWFVLGDRDLAIHIVRTHMLRQGFRLTEITRYISNVLKAKGVILPMSDEHVETHIYTDLGDLHIQEYLVKYAAKQNPEKVKVFKIEYRGIGEAKAPPEVLNAITNADIIVIGPSNPFLSINPILSTRGVRECIRKKREAGVPIVAVSPIRNGRAFTGVAHVLLKYLGYEPTAYSIAEMYSDIISDIVIDSSDEHLAHRIKGEIGVDVTLANIAMDSIDAKVILAQKVLNIVKSYRRAV